MNGRVYDPIVGRFLSVDPLVGNPLSAQDYNGYSYCANNPMKYTDPSGYTYWKPVGNGEWEHFEYHPFQNGSANFREASNGGVAYYGAPMTYRYAAGQYRDEKGNVVSYEAVHKNYIAPNSAKVESYSALLGYLADGFSFRYETAGNYWGYVAVDDGKSIGVLAFSKINGIIGAKATKINNWASRLADGFMHPGSETNMSAASNVLSAEGVLIGGAKLAIIDQSKAVTTTIRAASAAARSLNVATYISNRVGIVGAGFVLLEGYYDSNGLTPGDVIKAGLCLGITYTGWWGVGYAVIDLGVGLTTEYTVTDRIGAGIDRSLGY